MKVNRDYIMKVAEAHYKTEYKLEIYDSLAEDLKVSQRSITRFLDTTSISLNILLGIQKLLNLEPSKIFIN